jgi:hypothetical protein
MKEQTEIGPGWLILRDGESWCAVGAGDVSLRPMAWGRSPLEAYTALKAKCRKQGKQISLPALDDFVVRL